MVNSKAAAIPAVGSGFVVPGLRFGLPRADPAVLCRRPMDGRDAHSHDGLERGEEGNYWAGVREHAPADRDDEARDQHLFAGADAAGAVRQRAGAALWRGGDPRLSRDRHGSRRLSRSRPARRGRDRLADRRRSLAEQPGRGRRLCRDHRADLRRGGSGRVRRHHARPARRHGHAEPGGWRGTVAEAAARDRPGDPDRGIARHARQSL